MGRGVCSSQTEMIKTSKAVIRNINFIRSRRIRGGFSPIFYFITPSGCFYSFPSRESYKPRPLPLCICTLGCDGQDRWVTEEASTEASVGSITKCRHDCHFASRPVGGGRWAGLIGSLLLSQGFIGLFENIGLYFMDHTLTFLE